MARVAAKVQCELYHRLKQQGIECEAEYALAATSPRSKRKVFYADIAVLQDGQPMALAECKSKPRKELRGQRQRQNYDGCGLPYIVAAPSNIGQAVEWLSEQVKA